MRFHPLFLDLTSGKLAYRRHGVWTPSPASGLPDHASRHQNGGADEIDVTGLSGLLADAQKVTVRINSGANTGSRKRLNLVAGTGITLTAGDDAGDDEIDIGISNSDSYDSDTDGATTTSAAGTDTDIVFSIGTGVYFIEGYGTYNTAGAGNAIQSTFAASGGLTAGVFELTQRAITGAVAEQVSSTTTLGTFTAGTVGVGATSGIQFSGFIRVTNGGTLTFRIATSLALSAVTLVECHMILKKIA